MAERSHILIVEARYYEAIADEMARGAVAALENAGAAFERITVPGAFEIPAAVQMAVQTGSYDGYVALGCVIRGETTHYDYVCGESARGLQDLAIRHAIAIGYGIVTVENEAQAWDRARVDRQDKGGGAARACLDMLALRRRFNLDPR
jgi:6,7-dimethyl-8-ribityllumazine synthase